MAGGAEYELKNGEINFCYKMAGMLAFLSL
jgi:hypothetical protein